MPALNAVVANMRKVVVELRRYLPNTVSMLIVFYVIFLFMMLGVRLLGDPASAVENIRYVIVANVCWFLLILGVSGMGWEMTTEATRGTLEQLYMSTTPSWLILLSRILGTLLANLMLMSLMVMLSMLTARQWLNIDALPLLLILPATMVSVVGMGYLVAGLAIAFKQIQAMLQIVQFVFMGFAFVPPGVVPGLELAPAVKGIDMVRRVMVYGQEIQTFALSDWAVLLLSGVFYLALGLVLFRLFERRAMARGLLGHY